MKNLLFKVFCDMEDDGVPESVYILVHHIIDVYYGIDRASNFAEHVNATDGCFYLRDSSTPEIVLNDCCL